MTAPFADPPVAASDEVDVSVLYFPRLQTLQKPLAELYRYGYNNISHVYISLYSGGASTTQFI